MKRGLLGTSLRRQMLDRDLEEACCRLSGLVVDLGGEWLYRRGDFRPPRRPGLWWLCLNVDRAVAPNLIADLVRTPLASACAEAAVCTEVLEHLMAPGAGLAEAFRILKPGGWLIASVPFLHPVHADPYDYYRYTEPCLRILVGAAGFEAVDVHEQGLYFTSLADFACAGLARARPAPLRWGLAVPFLIMVRLLRWLEAGRREHPFIASYPGGFFLTAPKPGGPRSSAEGPDPNAVAHMAETSHSPSPKQDGACNNRA